MHVALAAQRDSRVALRVEVGQQRLGAAPATQAVRLTEVVVFPTPPFWLATA